MKSNTLVGRRIACIGSTTSGKTTLATRLGAQIARARQLYEQRVPPQVGQRDEYFHAELVRTLADGDAALLEMP